MLEYFYIPQTDDFVREKCHIRDIASVWDIESLGSFLSQRELPPVIDQGFHTNVERHPARQVSMDVACALEVLNEAYAIALASEFELAERYRLCLCAGLTYLLRLQCVHNRTERERDSFGLSLDERAQRIDITGPAASALMKSVENGIECGSGCG